MYDVRCCTIALLRLLCDVKAIGKLVSSHIYSASQVCLQMETLALIA